MTIRIKLVINKTEELFMSDKKIELDVQYVIELIKGFANAACEIDNESHTSACCFADKAKELYNVLKDNGIQIYPYKMVKYGSKNYKVKYEDDGEYFNYDVKWTVEPVKYDTVSYSKYHYDVSNVYGEIKNLKLDHSDLINGTMEFRFSFTVNGNLYYNNAYVANNGIHIESVYNKDEDFENDEPPSIIPTIVRNCIQRYVNCMLNETTYGLVRNEILEEIEKYNFR